MSKIVPVSELLKSAPEIAAELRKAGAGPADVMLIPDDEGAPFTLCRSIGPLDPERIELLQQMGVRVAKDNEPSAEVKRLMAVTHARSRVRESTD